MKRGPSVQIVGARSPEPAGKGPRIESLIVPRVKFPIATRPPAIGGVIGRSPITPDQLVSSGAASEQVGRFVLPKVGTLFAPDTAWKKLNIDRPMIVMSLNVNDSGILSPIGPVIRYNYGKIPQQLSESQVSERTGICFLSNPGTWFLKAIQADVEDDNDNLDCLLIDASNPEVASRFLRQPGVNVINEFNVPVTSAAVPVSIPTGGRFTREVTIQNVPPAGGAGQELRYALSDSPQPYLAGGGVGFRLLVNGSATFSGNGLTRGVILVMLEAAGATNVEVAQFRDL